MKQAIKNALLPIIYARRELRGGIKGFYIFLACLILGVSTIAGIHSLSNGMMDSLRNDGRYILGGDLALRTIYQPATPEQVKFLQQRMGVTTVVMETRAMARRADEKQASLTELKAIDPFYPLYGQLTFKDEAGKIISTAPQEMVLPAYGDDGKETGLWGAAVEKELLTRLNIHIGDSITIGKQTFEIRGIIAREPDRISSQKFSIAPRVMISRYTFNKTGLQEQGNQVYYDHRLYMPYVRTPQDMTDAMAKITKAFPKASWKGRTWQNASPRTERMINRLTLFLTFIGLTTLLIGGVGISNAVRSFLDTKLANIATLKCLGASSSFVSRIYMTMILLLTTCGTIIGLILGAGVAKLAGTLLTEKLSLTNQVGIYPSALIIAALFGFLISFCFSLWPIAQATAVTPRELFRNLIQSLPKRPPYKTILWTLISVQLLALLAIATASSAFFAIWFLVCAISIFAIFYVYAGLIKSTLKRIRLPVRPEIRMALANLYRPGNISTSLILSLGLGLTVLVSVALVRDNFTHMLSDDLSGGTPSFFFLDIQPNQKEGFMTLLNTYSSVKKIHTTPSFRGHIVAANGVEAKKALVDETESWVISSDRGFTVARTLPDSSEITAGEWWAEDYNGPPIISIATDVAKAFDITVGDKLTVNIFGADVTAEVANVRDINWTSFSMNFAVTFAPSKLLTSIPSNAIGTVIMDEVQEEEMQVAIARKFPNITVVRVRDAITTLHGLVRNAAQAISLSAGITLLAGILVLAGGISAARRRHIYDAVVLKVLGATRRRILLTFLLEYGLLGILTLGIAAILGTLSARAILIYIMDMPWVFHPFALIRVSVLCLSITILSGFIGTWHALLQKPASFLRHQQ